MAYPEEEGIRTSLLQGAVRVEGAGAPGEKLVPGQEALWNGQAFRVSEADTDQAVAWKNGLFQFDGATLEAVMRQVCRWYDVDVRYEGKVPRHFSGMISRSSPLTEVLRMLDLAGKARFTLEGRTVVVKAN
jgi:ferric-dicitrate binding protein FerR (iron transport regulator)